ncbi:hypothetical protein [Noviherbaspirillum saxi]|uniref:Uncharacterized protein n=1 Tax=Noviherbaspirillum saxi TaxID=2320863 RepID=A0A3A3G684_9BURK|nr:hypothetical protein [Noviherbaspirillum saxi]RJF95690.1 hypothetical protein D3871_20130 [Noviherbaspirillum saxi]
MDTLKVIDVRPYTPGDECADVLLRSAKDEATAFCHLCNVKPGDIISNRLSTLDGDVRSAFLSDWPSEMKEAHSSEYLEKTGNYSYRGRGQVIDHAEGLVRVQGFVIDFGSVPCDGIVDFEITRLDLRDA